MHLIVGLGNPGKKYQDTRHNLGWLVIQQTAKSWGISLGQAKQAYQGEGKINGHSVILALPQIWMNQTGLVVRSILQDLQLTSSNLIVVYDDLDLPFGAMKIKVRGGPGGHNGLGSVSGCLGTEEFCRLKVGISRPPETVDAAQFVLTSFTSQEREQLQQILPKAVEALSCLVVEGPSVTMNRFHERTLPERTE